jgi:VIT1/CCC1 family predicted Fe2+/Mn2+ transporter
MSDSNRVSPDGTGVPLNLENALRAQRKEITEYHVYERLSRREKKPDTKRILEDIATDEKRHYEFWTNYTHRDAAPSTLSIWAYYLVSMVFGLTFTLKLMEKGEGKAQETYSTFLEAAPEVHRLVQNKTQHESLLVDLVEDEYIKYIGAILRGLDSAVVSLTGVLVGLTFVLKNSRFIGLAGLLTGIVMSLSLAVTEYLGIKVDKLSQREPVEASQSYGKGPLYTGLGNLAVTLLLVFPFLFFSNRYVALGFGLFNAAVAIPIFNFYISVARDVPFTTNLKEMLLLSLGTAILAFLGANIATMLLSAPG